jgi:hypothetical protein
MTRKRSELLELLQWYVNIGDPVPQELVRRLTEAGVAVVTVAESQQRIDIAPDYEEDWKRLTADADEAEEENSLELRAERLQGRGN